MKLKFFSIAFPVATMTFLAAIGAALWFVAASFSEVGHALKQRKVTLALTSELSRLTETMSRLVRAFAGAHGIPLGIMGDYAYQTNTRQLARGECVFAYTDGVTEAMAADSSFYSDQRLQDVLKPLAGAPARAVVSEVIASVRDFSKGEPRADDIAVIAIRLVDA